MQSLLHHASLIDCRRLFLRDYEVRMNIGVHDFEKRGEQRVLINVDLYVPLAQSTPSNDTLDEVVDYDFIRRSIVARIARGLSGERDQDHTECSHEQGTRLHAASSVGRRVPASSLNQRSPVAQPVTVPGRSCRGCGKVRQAANFSSNMSAGTWFHKPRGESSRDFPAFGHLRARNNNGRPVPPVVRSQIAIWGITRITLRRTPWR